MLINSMGRESFRNVHRSNHHIVHFKYFTTRQLNKTEKECMQRLFLLFILFHSQS